MSENKKFDKNPHLLALSAEGNEEATEELIRYNAGLVTSIASRFLHRGTDMEDLVQIGNMGLLKAIRTFDPARECAFSTYAVPMIQGEIKRFMRDDGMIKVSRSIKENGVKINKIRRSRGDGCHDFDH